MAVHFDGWLGLLRFGGGDLLDLAAGPGDVLHRSAERDQFRLELLQTVRRFFQPASGGRGQKRNAVTDDSEKAEENYGRTQWRRNVKARAGPNDWPEQITEQEREHQRQQQRSHEVHRVKDRENEKAGEIGRASCRERCRSRW